MCETGVFYTLIQRFDLRLYAKHRAFAHLSVFFVPERFRAMRSGYVTLWLIKDHYFNLGFGVSLRQSTLEAPQKRG